MKIPTFSSSQTRTDLFLKFNSWHPKQSSALNSGKRLPIRRLRSGNVPDAEYQRQIQEAMKDPKMQETMKQMNEMFKNPAIQQQLQQTMSMLQNQEMQMKIESLRNDPELEEKFKEIESGGMAAFMKLYNDPEFLKKVGEKMGPIAEPVTESVANKMAAQPLQAAAPDIKDLIDAAKFGDLEAVEDFLAIGKDPNTVDEHNRSPLHFAAATEQMDIMDALMGAGANIQITDSKGNSPLHYAAGYGCVVAVKRLLDAGADGSLLNDTGKVAADVAKLSEENPVFKDKALLQRLEDARKPNISFKDNSSIF